MGLASSNNPLRVLHVVQGTVGVTDDPGLRYCALVGASVVVGLCDPIARLGGMAHFEFPGDGEGGRFAAPALQMLIQQVQTRGGRLDRSEARLFGGAKIHDGAGDMGKRTTDFALQTLRDLGVTVVGADIGTDAVRRVKYAPTLGKSTVVMQVKGMPIAPLSL